MAGSKKAAFIYVLSALMFVVQMVVSLAVFSDINGAILGVAFVIIMFIGAGIAWVGKLSDIYVVNREYEVGGHSTVREYKDSGQSMQCAPCFGIAGGVVSIILVLLIGAELIGTELFVGLVPGILGGILGIVAAIIFILEYKGPWGAQRF